MWRSPVIPRKSERVALRLNTARSEQLIKMIENSNTPNVQANGYEASDNAAQSSLDNNAQNNANTEQHYADNSRQQNESMLLLRVRQLEEQLRRVLADRTVGQEQQQDQASHTAHESNMQTHEPSILDTPLTTHAASPSGVSVLTPSTVHMNMPTNTNATSPPFMSASTLNES